MFFCALGHFWEVLFVFLRMFFVVWGMYVFCWVSLRESGFEKKAFLFGKLLFLSGERFVMICCPR